MEMEGYRSQKELPEGLLQVGDGEEGSNKWRFRNSPHNATLREIFPKKKENYRTWTVYTAESKHRFTSKPASQENIATSSAAITITKSGNLKRGKKKKKIF